MKRKTIKTPKRSRDLPVTVSMLELMEGRLTNKINGLRDEFKSDVYELRSDIHELKGDVQGIKADLHRVALLVEEQNARNKYVLDGYAQIYELLARQKDL